MTRRLDNGMEIADPSQVEVPTRLKRPFDIRTQVQHFVASELSRRAAAEGYESFDEADDFNVGDEDPRSIHELDDDQLEYDIRYDPRYIRRNDGTAETSVSGVGGTDGHSEQGGKSGGKDKQAVTGDKQPVSGDVPGGKTE